MNTITYSTIIVKTVAATTNSIYTLIKYIINSNEPLYKNVQHEITLLDLEFYIGIVNELIKEYDSFICGNSDNNLLVSKAIVGVNDIMEKIYIELEKIGDCIKYHNSKWFNTYRTFNCDSNIQQLKEYKTILDKRYGVLIDLLKLHK